MEKIYKWIYVGIIISIIIIPLYYMYIFLTMDFFEFDDLNYSRQDLIENYESHQQEINELIDFVSLNIPQSTSIDVEFEEERLAIFHLIKDGNRDFNWDVGSDKTTLLLNKIGWTTTTLNTLKVKLDKANCISIETGNPFKIGWKRSGLGKYYYNIFDQNLNDSLISRYNNGCAYVFYKNNIVLEYGGGAIGPNCFPENK